MEISITREDIAAFKKFSTDPAFIEYLSVNAPSYLIALLVMEACKTFGDTLSQEIEAEE